MTRRDTRRPPDELLKAVSRDLRPRRPARLPSRQILRWALITALVLATLSVVLGFRGDVSGLGPVLGWGASGAQLVLAAGLLWFAARETLPSRLLPLRLGITGLVSAGVFLVVVPLLTVGAGPAAVQAAPVWDVGAVCYRDSTSIGAIVALLGAWLLVATRPARPWLAGALFGMGGGLAVDGAWRLLCPVSGLSHVLIGHGGAVITLSAVGAVIAPLLVWIRVRR